MRKRSKPLTYITLALLLVAAFIGAGIYGKYITEVNFSGSVTFSANLAEKVELYEHKAERKNDGNYQLNPTVTVQSNDYILMPGVDIPKDPQIKVTGKSAVEAYLYVEVVPKDIPPTVTYAIDEHWLRLDTVTGPHGEMVYVYSQDTNSPLVLDDETFSDASLSFPILKDNTVTVSEHFSGSADFHIDFYAYMVQKINAETATEAFARSGFTS